MYAFRATLDPVELAFTDRHGGVDDAGLDLSLDGARLQANLDRLVADFAPGASVALATQVHGRGVALADPAAQPEADALITDRPGLLLLVRAADCVPVLLADPQASVVGAAHAGRQGLAAGVVPAVVAAMRDLGARDLTAWIGPFVCGACYEVPAQLRATVGRSVPEAPSLTSWGTPSLDLGAGVRAQLLADAVRVVDASVCTRESPELFSYRRDGEAAGRHAAVIGMRPWSP